MYYRGIIQETFLLGLVFGGCLQFSLLPWTPSVTELTVSYITVQIISFSMGSPFPFRIALDEENALFAVLSLVFLDTYHAAISNAASAMQLLCVAIIGMSSAAYPLDWNQPWQRWPVPTVVGTMCGITCRSVAHLAQIIIVRMKYNKFHASRIVYPYYKCKDI
jgi:hypothetical protein